ncbi:MAG: hypothetical protein ACD_49C00067G0033 [uncultured bacterium (gcode 4)]|uniref:GGDEF domain-containing protein n=1 Tax=uncultured bacterium (gcode 4) TaxID=1234023 RepID=K2AW47_9BACT|nr:MAG: hypothetical protein ACD_49C00067G0033 [uncultured bacterium (gcode 4)]
MYKKKYYVSIKYLKFEIMWSDNKEKIQLKAAKTYLTKLAEKYKSRWYESIFLEKDFNYLSNIKNNIELINKKNRKIDDIFFKNTVFIEQISENNNIDKKTKDYLLENFIDFFWDFVDFCDIVMESEGTLIQNIDTFRKIEKEINTKTKALTKYWFDKEFSYIFNNLLEWVHSEISVIIFDQNNLKNINENYGHEIGQESIYKFWKILREELEIENFNYILSNYYGWDEWFLVLIDVDEPNIKNFINSIFLKLKNNIYKIKNFDIELWACAWITYYKLNNENKTSIFDTKLLLHITDTLLLQAKVQKSRNKSWLAYKAMDVSNMRQEEIKKIYKKIQILPIKLKKQTLDNKGLKELIKIRKKQNEKIMKARTLWVKKVLRRNIDLINEIIWQKIVDQITKAFKESKQKMIKILPQLSEKIYKELSKNFKTIDKNDKKKKEILNKIIKSKEIKKLIKENINVLYKENIFE